jgi:Gpi18-like mannosyltransferase
VTAGVASAGWIRPISPGVFAASLCAYVVLRVWLAFVAGYEVDVNQYKEWALGSGLMGFPAIYEVTSADYPPLSLMAFYAVGVGFVSSQPPFASGQIPVEIVPTYLIKLPHLIFDLLIGVLIAWLVARVGLWGTARSEVGWGRLAAMLYWWNPAVLFGSAYWGQLDSMHAFFAIGAVAAMGADRMGLSGASLAAAGLSKPLAAPLVPLLALGAWLRRGATGFFAAGVSGLAVAILVFAPFWLTGRLLPVLERVVGDVEAMSYTSVNAHNFWWWMGAWQDAGQPWIGPFTARDIGIGVFLLLYLAILLRIRGWLRHAAGADYRAGLFVVSAGVMASFFFFSTHMHENHLFLALPLLLAVAGRNRQLAALAGLCTVAIFLNEFLHDPELPYQLPGFLSEFSSTPNPHLGRPFTQLQIYGSYVNSVFTALLMLGLLREVWVLGREQPKDHLLA